MSNYKINVPLQRFLDDIIIDGEYEVVVYDDEQGDVVNVTVEGNEQEIVRCICAVDNIVVIEIDKSSAYEKAKEERRQRIKEYKKKQAERFNRRHRLDGDNP